MKRILLIFTTILFLFLMTACTSEKTSPLIIKEIDAATNLVEEDNLEFNIEQTILSKGFQNLEPKVDILKKDDGFRLLASLGLFETSGVNIIDINKSGDEIDIRVENIYDTDLNQLAIPQVIIELKDIKLRNIENTKFNIINENYKPLKTKLSANEAINKVNSDFQIVTSTSPDINIIKDNEDLLWELKYKNFLDKYNLETPIVNMSVLIDANSGELVKSSKNFISVLIDEGGILDYIPNENILYKKEEKTLSKENKWISLLKYDIAENIKEILYSTNSEILSAQYSPNLDSIGLIESSNGSNQLYILSKGDNKAYKVILDNTINPSIIRWKDNDNLYIVSKTDIASTIYNYNIQDSNTELVNFIYSDIVGMQIQNDNIIITIKDKDTGKNSIQMTSNWIHNEIEEEGHTPRFINEEFIGYLKFDEKNNTHDLVIFNKETNKKHSNIDLNVSNYFKIDDHTVGIISINTNNSDYTFHKYDIKKKKLKPIVNITSDKAYYDSENELLYIDLKVPFESTKPQIIYSLDLSKINTTEPLVKK
ncbi:MAG: hypothetical protein GX053_13740 [Tissierella sp.]|nr:hypothetical protein [Tissierella sp.]